MDVFAVLFSRQGRIGRTDYWTGACVMLALAALQFYINPPYVQDPDLTLALAAFAVGVLNFWISICVVVKRYHDRGKAAYWYLVSIIPVVGWIWSFIELGLLRGDEGPNEYGPDPLSGSNIAGEIEAMRDQAAPQPVPEALMPRRRVPYNDGRPVFGKRV